MLTGPVTVLVRHALTKRAGLLYVPRRPGIQARRGFRHAATRRAFNKRFLLDLAEDWHQHGREVFKRVRRESPATYLKVCAAMVPREVPADLLRLGAAVVVPLE